MQQRDSASLKKTYEAPSNLCPRGLYVNNFTTRKQTKSGSKEPLLCWNRSGRRQNSSQQASRGPSRRRNLYPRRLAMKLDFPMISHKNPKGYGKITQKTLFLAYLQTIKALKLDSFARLLKKSKRNVRFCCIFLVKIDICPAIN